MSRHGYTLLEVLLSLVLLGSLTIATVSWTTGSLRAQEAQLASAEDRRAAWDFERTLRIDLLNDDVQLSALARREHRVRVSDGTLYILCRDAGPAEVSYRQLRDGTLERTVRSLGAVDRGSVESIAHGIEGLEWILEADDVLGVGSVSARWISARGNTASFTLDIPREWLP